MNLSSNIKIVQGIDNEEILKLNITAFPIYDILLVMINYLWTFFLSQCTKTLKKQRT